MVRLCQEFGWTVAEARGVMADPFLLADILGVLDAQHKITKAQRGPGK